MHIGLILDGNRRWAREHGHHAGFGHKKGVENFEKILEYIYQHQKIQTVSAYVLSTENLQRSPVELKSLFELLSYFLKKKKKQFIKQGIRVIFSGDLTQLPPSLQTQMRDVAEETALGEQMQLNICVAYGGRNEIVRAAQKLAESGGEFTESNLQQHLDTASLPNLDLVIRTGGNTRLSNFLLWQAAYAELYFTPVLWPAFSPAELEQALIYYESQQKNFGK